MADKIKGITVEIGGNVTPLNSALKDVNKTSRDLQSELKAVNQGLKLDPTNTTLLEQKQKLLAESIVNTKSKIDVLKTAEKQAEQQFKDGKIGEEQYRALQREVVNAESALRGLETENRNVTSATEQTNASQSRFGQTTDKLKISTDQLKTAFGAVGLAASAYLKGAVDSATAAEKSTDRLTNLLKNQGLSTDEASSSMKEFTNSITKMSDYSGGEAKTALQTLAERGIKVKDALNESNTVANIAAGMDIDLADAANLLADAQQGKTKALIKLGVLTKDEIKNSADAQKADQARSDMEEKIKEQLGDTTEAQQLINDMYAGNTETLVDYKLATKSEAETLANAGGTVLQYSDLQSRLNEHFSGAAQTNLNTYAGQMKEMQNQLNASKTQIGTALLPVLTVLAQSLSKILAPIADFISKNPQFVAAVLAIVAVVGTLVGGLSMISTVVTGMGALGGIISTLGATIGGASIPILLVVAAIVAVSVAVYEIIKHWSQISKFFSGVWTDTKKIFMEFWTWLKAFFTQWGPLILTVIAPFIGIPLLIKQHWGQIKEFFSELINDIGKGLVSAGNGISSFFVSLWTGIKNFFISAWNGIVSVVMTILKPFINGIMNIFNNMKGGLILIFDGFKSFFSGIWLAIKNIFLGGVLLILDLVTGNFKKLHEDSVKIFNNLKQAFSSILLGIKSIFVGEIQAIVGFFIGAWQNFSSNMEALWNALTSFMAALWEGIKATAINGWTSLKTGVITLIAEIITGAINTWTGLVIWFENLPSRLYTAAVNMFTSMQTGATNTVTGLHTAIVDGITNALAWIEELPKKMFDWGVDMIVGFINGIESMFNGINKAVNGVADKIRAVLHFSVPDEGPLTDYESWMPDFMKGLADGINSSKKIVADAIGNVAGDIKIGMLVNPTIKNQNLGAQQSNNQDSNMTNASNKQKQPLITQFVLPDGKVVAEWLVDDIDTALDKKTVIKVRQGDRP